MKADPRVRKDGRCFQCHGPRHLPKNRQKGVDPGVYLRDPFCATSCCRTYHDNPLPVMAYNPTETRGKHERVAA